MATIEALPAFHRLLAVRSPVPHRVSAAGLRCVV